MKKAKPSAGSRLNVAAHVRKSNGRLEKSSQERETGLPGVDWD
ncbi:hypothetical protein ACFQ5Q_19355 [Luteolibacter ambystomatis]|nr:hypothetical protein [Luteolibacter ambystomatis]